jgi:hypothetical protein
MCSRARIKRLATHPASVAPIAGRAPVWHQGCSKSNLPIRENMSLNDPLTFAAGGGELDRASHLRPDSAALLARADARLLPQWQEKPLIDISGSTPALGWIAPDPALVALAAETPVFLGIYQDTPCFTADFSCARSPVRSPRPRPPSSPPPRVSSAGTASTPFAPAAAAPPCRRMLAGGANAPPAAACTSPAPTRWSSCW